MSNNQFRVISSRVHVITSRSVGAVCSEEETESDYSRSRHDAIANTFTTSDVLANFSVSLEVNYKIVKKKPKIEEKIPM